MNRQQKDILEPYAEQYVEIYERVRGLEDEPLGALLDACKAVSQTNCWCMTYDVANIIRPIAQREIFDRSRKALTTEKEG